jgi:hypothetical protein
MSTLHPFFGRDPDSYNIDLDTDNTSDTAPDGSGRPGIAIVIKALTFWVGQQPGPVTVCMVAQSFHMPIDAVVAAVEEAMWMFLLQRSTDPAQWVVELEGE